MDYETAMTRYMNCRRTVAVIDAKAAAEAAPYKGKMQLLLQWMEAKANKDGLKNVPVAGIGTGYWTTHISASVANPEEFRQFVRSNNAWDLMETRASSTGVKSFIDANNTPVPGVNFSQTRIFQVRAASSTSDKE